MLKDYIDLNYEPKNDLICEYYLEPSKNIDFESAANHVAGESSIDTWSDILTLSPKLAKKLKPHVFFINKKDKTIKIAYHRELFEINSVPQILSSVAGNIFSMKIISNLRLQDILFPKKIVKQFKGPMFGIKGIRKLLGVYRRPLIGTIVKPKVGLTTEKHAKVAYESWVGGCDLVKDDENLANQKFNPFEKRVIKTLKMRDKAEKETGERKIYMPNITAPTCDEMVKRAKFIKNHNGEYAMIDIIPVGWVALQTLREANNDLKLVLHAHRCMHSAFTRNPKHGISMLVIAKLTRLIGLDQLHIGTVVGKMHGGKGEVEGLDKALKEKWEHIKPTFPAASGGLEASNIPDLIKIFGKDIILQFGGGIHAHPDGTRAGAKEVRVILDEIMKGN